MLAWARYARPDDDPAQPYVHTFHKLADVESEALGPRFHDLLRTDSSVADDVRPYLAGPRALRHASFLHRLCEANLWLKGAGNILPRIDLAMGSAGLEAVSPLLDEALVRRTFLLAPSQKQRGIIEKWVLRHALRSRLPATILDLPKRGMKVPLRPWFEGKLGKVAKDVLLSRTARQRGLLSPDFVKKVIADDIRAPDLRRRRRDEWLWMALIAELWMQQHT
jgi:asparagine synthase (glutamine-hydrolysing)